MDTFLLIHLHQAVLFLPLSPRRNFQPRGPTGVFTRTTFPARGSLSKSLHHSSGFHFFHSPVPVLTLRPSTSGTRVIVFWIVLTSGAAWRR
jgi:hypothetical protein